MLWNLASCSRLTKCHQLGQQRAFSGLAFLIEEMSLSHKMYPENKWEDKGTQLLWKTKGNKERRGSSGNTRSCTSQRHKNSDLKREGQKGDEDPKAEQEMLLGFASSSPSLSPATEEKFKGRSCWYKPGRSRPLYLSDYKSYDLRAITVLL